MPKKIVGINENFSKRDQEMVSEIIWDAVREHDDFCLLYTSDAADE